RIDPDTQQRGKKSRQRRDLEREQEAVLDDRPDGERRRTEPAQKPAPASLLRSRRVVVWRLRRDVGAALVLRGRRKVLRRVVLAHLLPSIDTPTGMRLIRSLHALS